MNWKLLMEQESRKPYFQILKNKLTQEREDYTIYPDKGDEFKALVRTPFDKVKVVIIGQDPYFDGNATGVAFECKIRQSPTLEKINQVIAYQNKIAGFYSPCDLTQWTEQGVFLLNPVLTVRGHSFDKTGTGAKSHYDLGWQDFTHEVIRMLVNRPEPIVFLLWGAFAKENFLTAILGIVMDWKRILVVESHHPNYATYRKSAWESNDCFNKANTFLSMHNLTPIIWPITAR